ncbi:MAG: hypothetical protein V4792_09870 [Pseudomonadota bacterium]
MSYLCDHPVCLTRGCDKACNAALSPEQVGALITRLRRDNAALLAALSKIAGLAPGEGDVCELIARIARAAIAQAQEPQS